MSRKFYMMNNLLIVKNTDNKWGAFNKELENILPFDYESIYRKVKSGRDFFFIVRKDGYEGFVPVKNISEFIKKHENWDDELAYHLIKEKNSKYGITDIKGNFIILPIYDKVEWLDISESYNYYDVGQEEKMLSDRYLLYKDGKIGFADLSNVLCPPMYDEIYAVSEVYRDRLEHIFRVKKDGLFGYMNAEGKIVCDIKYDEVVYPCIDVLTYAQYGSTIDIINLEQSKVIYSVEKDNIGYINIDYKHCCIAKKNENCVYVLDCEGKVLAKFEIPKEIQDYKICYVNRRFLGYKKRIPTKKHYEIGLIDYNGEILSSPKYSEVLPIKGTYTVVTDSLFGKESELLDENCNVIMNNFISLRSMDYDAEFGIIPPLIYQELNSEDSDMHFTDKNLNPEKKTNCCLENNRKVVNFLQKKEDQLFLNRYEFEEEGKRYTYCILPHEKKIQVLNEDESLYKSIDFEISNKDDIEFLDLW